MSCGLSSGLTSGKQGTLEEEEIFLQSKDNENRLKKEYLNNILSTTYIGQKRRVGLIERGALENNHDLYNGYEGERVIIITLQSNEEYVLHIWNGYFEDIFGNPIFNQSGFKGFSRDYQECLGAFAYGEKYTITNIQEYLTDLEQYREKQFLYDGTKACLQILIEFFMYAKSISSFIEVQLN